METTNQISPPQPTSPGVGAVAFLPAVGELLRFVLSSHVASPDPALPLSLSYCSRLLEDDLYNKLATELAGCAEEGRIPKPPVLEGAVGTPAEENDSRKREGEWEAILREKAAELKRMYDAVEFVLHVQEPYFTQLSAGSKNVEGRLAAGNYNRITQGSLLLFNKCLLLEVEAIRKYSSFSEMLQAETISNVLPGISSVEEGVKVYRNFYTEEKENSYGVLAISVSKPQIQPYVIMTKLLAGLGYDGLGRLLGLANTSGTVPDGLPPPRSVLISSCMKLHKPTVKSCSLTDAARALAKHVHRSRDGWWGCLHGSDPNKNQISSEVIDRLLCEGCWINIHLTQPHGPVFEIRVHEGYGARWSHDGLKFIGFLEPYTPDGFLNGWKH